MIRNVVEVQRDAAFDAIGRHERVAWVNERGFIQRASLSQAAPFGRRTGHWMIGTLSGLGAQERRRWSNVSTSHSQVRDAVQRAVAFIPIEATDGMANEASEDPMDAINVMIGNVRDGAGTSQSIMAFQPFEVAGAGGDDDDTVVIATSRVTFRPHRLVVHSSAPPDIEVQLQVGITICVDWTPVGMFSELAIGMGLAMPTVGQGEQVKLVARNRSSPDGAVMLAALTGVSVAPHWIESSSATT